MLTSPSRRRWITCSGWLPTRRNTPRKNKGPPPPPGGGLPRRGARCYNKAMEALQRAAAAADAPLSEVKAFLAGAKPSCTLYVYPHSEHVSQIYAGFYAL